MTELVIKEVVALTPIILPLAVMKEVTTEMTIVVMIDQALVVVLIIAIDMATVVVKVKVAGLLVGEMKATILDL